MAATTTWYDYTGSSGSTETATTNANLMSTDAHDTGTLYQSNPISRPVAGSNYSYERILRLKWTGTYNTIDTVKFWKSAGTLSDAALILRAGASASIATPVNTSSATAVSAVPTSEGAAISVTTSGSTPNVVTYYIYTQLEVPSTVATPGDIGSQTYTLKWNEA